MANGLRVPAVSFSSSRDYLTGEWEAYQVTTGLNGGTVYNASDRHAFAEQPDQLIPFRYAGMWLGFLNLLSISPGPASYLKPQRVAGVGGDTTLQSELVASHDLIHWRRLSPGRPFLPRGGDRSEAADA